MLQFREATTELVDAEIVRTIRNSGRQWMTRDAREITPFEQAAWWATRDPVTCRIWIARIALTDIGYGLLRREGDRVWCSLAVLPQFRGQGYGSMIYRYLALATPVDVWAEILADNTPSIRACLRAGFQIAYAQDKLAVLVYRKTQ
jgi:RimJ/RimL family protein N-acetyltransferase